jgi:hypothetical protein
MAVVKAGHKTMDFIEHKVINQLFNFCVVDSRRLRLEMNFLFIMLLIKHQVIKREWFKIMMIRLWFLFFDYLKKFSA